MPQGAWERYLVPAVKPRPAWVLSVEGGQTLGGKGRGPVCWKEQDQVLACVRLGLGTDWELRSAVARWLVLENSEGSGPPAIEGEEKQVPAGTRGWPGLRSRRRKAD